MAKRVMEQLVENGAVVRGWLGVVIQDPNEELVEALDLEQPNGVLVTEVAKGLQQIKPACSRRRCHPPRRYRFGKRSGTANSSRSDSTRDHCFSDTSSGWFEDSENGRNWNFPWDQKVQKRRSGPKAQKSEVGLKRLGVKLANLTASKRRPLTCPRNPEWRLLPWRPVPLRRQRGFAKEMCWWS